MEDKCSKYNLLSSDHVSGVTSLTYSGSIPGVYSSYYSRGSAFFVKYGGYKFLITARHNLVSKEQPEINMNELKELRILQNPLILYTELCTEENEYNISFVKFSLININLNINDLDSNDFVILRAIGNEPDDKFCFDLDKTVYLDIDPTNYYMIGYPIEKQKLYESENKYLIHEISPRVIQLLEMGTFINNYQINNVYITKQSVINNFSGFSGSPILACDNNMGLILRSMCINAKTVNDTTQVRSIPIQQIISVLKDVLPKIRSSLM